DPAVVVSAVRLTRDYAAGDADGKYLDKPLIVEGVVVGRREEEGRPSLLLEGCDEKKAYPLRVAAFYAAERTEEFAPLKKGDKVRVKGLGGGPFQGEVQVRAARCLR